jgi:hypothetical protein
LLVGACLLAAAAACHSTSTGRAPPSSSAPSSDSGLSGVEQTAIAYFMPASSADLKTRLGLQNFLGAIAAKQLTGCLYRNGFHVQYPDVADTYDYSDANSLYPDLFAITATGLEPLADLRGERDPTPPVPRSERAAYAKVLQGCSLHLSQGFRAGTSKWVGLQNEWANIDAKGDSNPTYQHLLVRFATCVRSDGYSGSTPDTFLQGIDLLEQDSQRAGKPLSDQQRISLAAGKVYAKCYGPANAERQKIRLTARRQFLDDHALDIQQANRQLDRTITSLERKSGLTYANTSR